MKIAYLCRGQGFGHAARGITIVDELKAIWPRASVVMASSGTGIEYMRMRDRACDDLGVPDNADHSQSSSRRIAEYIKGLAADGLDLIVSDEYFFVATVAKQLDIPCATLTCFTGADCEPNELVADLMLRSAALALVPDWQELHQVSTVLKGKVRFLPPIVQTLSLNRSDARDRLGVEPDSILGVVSFGGLRADRLSRQSAMLSAILRCWQSSVPGKLYVLCSREDAHEKLGVRDQNARVSWVGMGDHPDPELYFSAADVVFTFGGSTMLKLIRSGIPAISFESRDCRDQFFKRRLQFLEARSANLGRASFDSSTDELFALIQHAIDTGRGLYSDRLQWSSALDVARMIAKVPNHRGTS